MRRIILDTETTGLNAYLDEVLQLAIIDADTGDVLHNKMYGTAQRKEWPGAEAVNGISPEDVAGLPTLYEEDEQAIAAEIIGAADWVGGWNTEFDLKMMWGYKIAPRDDAEIVDIMKLDAEICGIYTPLQGGSAKYRSLMNAATWWGYDLVSAPGVFHNAETDCLATRHVWKKIMQWKNAIWNTENRAVYLAARYMMRDIMQSCSQIQSEMLAIMCEPDDAKNGKNINARLHEIEKNLWFCENLLLSTSAGMTKEQTSEALRKILNDRFGAFGVE